MLFQLFTVTQAVKIPYAAAGPDPKLGVAIPYAATGPDPELGVAIPYAATGPDPKLAFAPTMLFAVQHRTFSDKSDAKAFFGTSFATLCGDQMCAMSELASNMPGWVCPQHKATSIRTHQQVICQYNGQWKRQTYPSDCNYNNEWQCTSPSNNCWNTPSYNCDNWCKCYGSNGVTSRLGASLLGAAAPRTVNYLSKVADAKDSKKDSVQGGGYSSCPWWLPAAYRTQMSTDGYQLTCFRSKGTFCAYPNDGMNFVCTGYDGIWKLQGAAPTPTPAPERECPGWWWIWGGITSCDRNGRICRYPEHFVNYVCERGTWQQQGNAPAPTQPPVQNPASCPDDEQWLRRGNYCSSPMQKCHYPNGVTWLCRSNGVWTSYRTEN